MIFRRDSLLRLHILIRILDNMYESICPIYKKNLYLIYIILTHGNAGIQEQFSFSGIVFLFIIIFEYINKKNIDITATLGSMIWERKDIRV